MSHEGDYRYEQTTLELANNALRSANFNIDSITAELDSLRLERIECREALETLSDKHIQAEQEIEGLRLTISVYDIGDYDKLKAEVEALRQALHDIAGGHVPPDEMPSMDDPATFRHAMWTWSQKRAREASNGRAE